MENENFSENIKEDIPNINIILILGISSIVFSWFYGLPGIAIGILSYSYCRKMSELLKFNPNVLNYKGLRRFKYGKAFTIFGLVVSILFFIMYLVSVLFTIFSTTN
jgi:hypothetical protein